METLSGAMGILWDGAMAVAHRAWASIDHNWIGVARLAAFLAGVGLASTWAVAVAPPSDPARPWRSRIGSVIMHLLRVAACFIWPLSAYAHAYAVMPWGEIGCIVLAGTVFPFAAPPIARVLGLPQLIAWLAPPFVFLARVFWRTLVSVANPVVQLIALCRRPLGRLLARLPRPSAFKLIMGVMLSGCALLAGLLAVSLLRLR